MSCMQIAQASCPVTWGKLLVALLYPIPSTGRPVLIPSLTRAVVLTSFGNPSVEPRVGQGWPGHATGCS